MKTSKYFTKISTIALTLMLALSAISITLPIAQAKNITTKAFLSVNPNPVGVNQQITIVAWVLPIPDYDHAGLFSGFTVTITKPDETTSTLGPKTAWPHGAMAWTYNPTTVGDYSFKFNYPGETFGGDEFLPAESPVTILTVQEEPTPDWPAAPLPSEYWGGVVNTENREWNQISGSWLDCYYNSTYTGFADATAGYNPYSTAPRTPHIMWTKQATTGGLAGGELQSFGEYSGLSYEVQLSPPIIMNGRLYYNTDGSRWGHFPPRNFEGFVCVDLRTGEELWRVEGNSIHAGQQYMSPAPGGQGVRSLLWDRHGSTWNVYDPFDGKLMMSFENATSGTNWWWEDPIVRGEDGAMYIYILDGYANSLTMWNSTKAFDDNGIISIASDGTLGFRERPGTYDWEAGIEWAVTIPDRNVDWHTPYSIFGISDGVALVKSGDGSNTIDFDIGYDIETGTELWANDDSIATQGWFSATGEGVYTTFSLPDRRWYGYDISTGTKLWEGDQLEYPWGTFVSYSPMIAYGKLLSGGWDGYLHAFDIADGSEVWKFYVGDAGSEVASGTWPVWYGPIVADGVAFIGTGEETPTQPLTRGNRIFAVDVETGEKIWSMAGYMSLRAVAEGYLLGYNGYDSNIYCIGKGPSATTASVQQNVITQGNNVMITGTVMDIAAGTKQDDLVARFPNGVPAISDEDMGGWMEYLYMQKPYPEDAYGVTVTIEAYDPNGNYQNYGTTTSDSNGNFGFVFEPEVPGTYWISATFEGSDSYYGSTSSTYLTVDPAPEPYPTVTIPPYPGYQGPSASDVAQNVINSLPEDATPAEIAQAIENQLTIPPATVIPEYTTIDLVIIVAVVAVAILVIYTLYTVKKLK